MPLLEYQECSDRPSELFGGQNHLPKGDEAPKETTRDSEALAVAK